VHRTSLLAAQCNRVALVDPCRDDTARNCRGEFGRQQVAHMTQSVRVVGARLGDRSGVTVEPQLTVQCDTERLDFSRDGQRRSRLS